VFGTVTGLGGAFAEQVVAETVAAKPPSMSWAEAAGIPSAAETARRGLLALGLREGQLVVVNGAGGAVGLAAVQLALAEGARVVATASTSNHDFLRGLGALVTTYGDGLPARVRDLTGDTVDAALDVGKDALPELIELTGSADKVVTLTDPAAADLGVLYSTGAPPENRALDALDLAARLFGEGTFTMPVAATFSMDDAAQAHRLSESGHGLGKIVVTVS
jgi:NADPH:quinone reductase-like Zn-dependent oxidoreductase